MNPLRDAPESFEFPDIYIEPRQRRWLELGESLGRWLLSFTSGHRHPRGFADTASHRVTPHEPHAASRGASGDALTTSLNPESIELSPRPE